MLKSSIANKGLGFNIRGYHERQNKVDKIQTYLYGQWKYIYFVCDDMSIHRDANEEYLSQITDWHELSETDDAPDTAATIIRELKIDYVNNVDMSIGVFAGNAEITKNSQNEKMRVDISTKNEYNGISVLGIGICD